jgi:D-alanyl-D-alanine carboxypeptidase/D-alanyl-D-alanine-endopeptidase (penicillin-binding protein 4)
VPTDTQFRLRGLAIGLWGRHELYVHSLQALLASHGVHVSVIEDPAIVTGASANRLQALLVESPLPSELEQLTSIGPPVIVLAERAEREEELPVRELGAHTTLHKNSSLADLLIAIRNAVEDRRPEPLRELTERQLEVLGLIAEGLDNGQIAARLGISQRTARAHVSSVLERLGVENRTQAAVTALRRGWVSLLILLAIVASSLTATPVAAAATARERLAAGVFHQLRAIGGGSGAWIADADSGRRLFAFKEGQSRTPASIEKPFTTSTALARLGAGFRIPTVVSADGLLTEDGTLTGSLYIKGFGDPSFGRSGLARLAAQVQASGVQRVTGRVYGDESYFDEHRGLPSGRFKLSVDIGPLSALAFNEGTLAGYGRGFQSDPPAFVAARLSAALRARGTVVEHRARAGESPKSAREITSVRSPTLATLVRHTNQLSNNYFAESLLKGLGARLARSGTTAAGIAVVKRFEEEIGVTSTVLDGSGLSRGDAVSPHALATLLSRAEQEPWFDAFYRSLPLAARSGTLRKRMRGTAAQGRCRAKTGTLIGVSSLAGYCRSHQNHRTVFALLMNGVNVASARRAQDRIAAMLAGYSG